MKPIENFKPAEVDEKDTLLTNLVPRIGFYLNREDLDVIKFMIPKLYEIDGNYLFKMKDGRTVAYIIFEKRENRITETGWVINDKITE